MSVVVLFLALSFSDCVGHQCLNSLICSQSLSSGLYSELR